MLLLARLGGLLPRVLETSEPSLQTLSLLTQLIAKSLKRSVAHAELILNICTQLPQLLLQLSLLMMLMQDRAPIRLDGFQRALSLLLHMIKHLAQVHRVCQMLHAMMVKMSVLRLKDGVHRVHVLGQGIDGIRNSDEEGVEVIDGCQCSHSRHAEGIWSWKWLR